VAIVGRCFHEPGEVGAGRSELAEQVFRRHADLRRQRAVIVDAAANGRSCRVGVNDERSLSWGPTAVNPHLVLTGNRPRPGDDSAKRVCRRDWFDVVPRGDRDDLHGLDVSGTRNFDAADGSRAGVS
jgi:hypothetical protein